jgi:hypothetical protein
LARLGLGEIGLAVDAIRNVGEPWSLNRISTTVNVLRRKEGGTSSYTEEPYLVRERYVLVAAIAIMTILVVWNIYFREGMK